MNIEMEKINSSKRDLLENLLQLYLHDLSSSFKIDFDSKTCKYIYNLDSYFDKNYAYFIKYNDNILGFVLIDDNSNSNYEISEIFVLNNYKRLGIGKTVAFKIFDMHKGNWTINAVPLSDRAEKFWENTINEYTNGDYKLMHTGKYNRAEFYFSNKK